MELDQSHPDPSGRLIVAAPSYVYTIERVAKMLGETVETLEEFVEQLEPEDGCLWIIGLEEEDSRKGFTERGVESLEELIADQRPTKTSE